ncbi:MAG: Zn-ribbon domain-containing OB-fold protein [Acidimicrobiia bacterium]
MADTDELEISMDADSAFYWEGTKHDQLLVQRCRMCSALRHPAGPVCPKCRSLEWDAEAAPSTGVLHSVAKVHYPTSPMQGSGYLICLVDLADGVRVAANLRDCELGAAAIGMPVELCFEPIAHGFKLPQFRPVPAASTAEAS